MAQEKWTVIFDIRSAGTLNTAPVPWKEIEVAGGTKTENASYGGGVCLEAGPWNPAEAKVAIVEAGSAQEATRLVRKQFGEASTTGAKCLTAKSSAIAETGY